MSWFKSALIEIDFDKRNLINHKIKYLNEIAVVLADVSKIVFQSASTAKQTNYDILNSKKMSSYNSIRDILIDADSVALDSPWRFAGYCLEAIDVIDIKLGELKEERADLFKETGNKVEKGWK
tara:strand:- start:5702 stop:6070 length:369 start_codon:yes stop_codon:yes gene_type:complete